MPIEIPVTIIKNKNRQDHTQIMPSPSRDMLPEGRMSNPCDLDIRFGDWLNRPDLDDTQEQAQILLKTVGKKALNIETNELLPLLKLEPPNQPTIKDPIPRRRILIYTDSASSTIPFETLYSDDDYSGKINFVTANNHFLVSIVRHLGLEATAPLEISSKKPLRMLIVFSNPQRPGKKLGEILLEETNNTINFSGFLDDEKKTIEQQLGILIQLGLLEVHFLVGDEASEKVFVGQILYDSRLLWKETDPINNLPKINNLRNFFVAYLNNNADKNNGCYWHVLHYFGHGVGDEDPSLELRPGNNLSCTDLGDKVSQMPRIVILNACVSANPTDFNAPTPTGFATLFLKRGTVNLICMQKKVSPQTATLTTKEIYGRLLYSLFTRQYDFEEALYNVRKEVYHGRLDFFCPVLYARPVDGPIFNYKDDRLKVWRLIQSEKSNLQVAEPTSIQPNEPLRMRVVFQNSHTRSLVKEENERLYFDGFFTAERKSLDSTLWKLLQLNLLEISFVVQDEETLYKGQVRITGTKNLIWAVNPDVEENSYHILHYCGQDVMKNWNPAKFNSSPKIVTVNSYEVQPVGPDNPLRNSLAAKFLINGTALSIFANPEGASQLCAITKNIYSKLADSLFTEQLTSQWVRETSVPVTLYTRPLVESVFNYQDDRLERWEMLQRQELPLAPLKLLDMARWSLGVKKNNEAITS